MLFALRTTRRNPFRILKYSRKCFSHCETIEEIFFALKKMFFTLWNNRKIVFHILKHSRKCISHFEILEGVLFTLWNKRKMFEKVFQLFFHATLNHLGSGFYIPPALTSLRPKFFGFFGTLNGSHITPLKYTSRHYTYRDIGFSLDPGGIHSPVYLWGVSQTLEPCYPPSVFRHNFGVHFFLGTRTLKKS